jgi:hypothetical protein
MTKENNNEIPPFYNERREKILEHLERERYTEAYSVIREVLNYPGQIEDDFLWNDALKLFERICRGLSGDFLGDLVKGVIEKPHNIDALYELSYELYEQNIHSIAATFLNKANLLTPQNERIVSELVSNLEALMMNKEATNILSEAKSLLNSSEICRYLYAFHSIMTGDIDTPEKILPTIQDSIDKDIQFMAKSIKGMLNRFSVLKRSRPLDNKDLRGWHMVMNGSVLLHLSPFGLDDAMFGRYAYITDSYSLCRHGIERVQEVLKVAEINLPSIIALPDRSSQILALATSKIVGKPLKYWDEIDINTEGLIVVYDLDEVQPGELLPEIADHRPGQLLWAHASCWTNPFPFSPDITTYLYQHNNSPWGGGGFVYNTKAKRVEISDSDKTADEELSLKIVDAEIDRDYIDDLEDLLAMINPLRNLSEDSNPGIYKTSERRRLQRTGSPVLSNRFV